MIDDQVTEYLRSRGRVDPPGELIGRVMRAVDAAPQRRATWFGPFVPAAVAIVAGAVVVVFAVVASQPRNVGPGPGASDPGSSGLSASPAATGSAQLASLVSRGDLATIPALDASGEWGKIRLERGNDVGGYRGVASVDPKLGVHYFENDPQAFYVEVLVQYAADRDPLPADFGSTDWALLAGDAELKPIGSQLNLAGPLPQLTPGYPGAIDIFSSPVKGWLVFAVPRTAENLTLRLAYIPTAAPRTRTEIAVRERGAAPQHVATARAPAKPTYVDKEGLAFSVVDSATADDLFATADSCTNPQAHYTVTYPDTWYTNTAIGDVPACSWFSPVLYEATGNYSGRDASPPPDEVVIVMNYSRGVGGIGGFGEPVRFSEQLAVDGREGVRDETVGAGDGLVPLGGYRYQYTITVAGVLPNEDNSAVVLFASTTWMPADDSATYELNEAVLDRIMASITFGD